MPLATNPAERLRSLMATSCVPIPGAFNALCARAIKHAGFDACYISGAATSVAAGVPDVGLLTLDHFARTIKESFDATGLPILADADTGFGEAEMVRRTVLEYSNAGAAGLHLEDQKFPKRCGHLDGKELVPIDHMCEKIEWAAKAARKLVNSSASFPTPPSTPSTQPRGTGVPPVPTSFLPASPSSTLIICARTDARGVEGFDAALKRAAAYVEAGADMIFPEGLTSEQEFADFATRLRAPCPLPSRKGPGEGSGVFLLANMTEFGKTPIIPLSKFQAMRYNCVIFPVSLLRVAMGAVSHALEQLKAHGSVEPFLNQMQTRHQLYDLINYQPGKPWEYPIH